MNFFGILFVCFYISHISDVILHFPSSVWLISLSTMPLISIQDATNSKILFFLWLKDMTLCVCVCVCVCNSFCIHSSINRHRLFSYIDYYKKNSIIIRGMQLYFDMLFFISFGYLPKGETDRSYGSYILWYSEEHFILYQIGYTRLHCHQYCTSVPFSSHSHKYLLFLSFWQ